MKRIFSLILAGLMVMSVLPVSTLADDEIIDDNEIAVGDDESIDDDEVIFDLYATPPKTGYDTSVSNDYFTVISEDVYNLAPGAIEGEIILNNTEGNDRKVVHFFEVDTKNENIDVLPGYYGIDKLDPDNLPLDGIADKNQFWKAEQLTKTVAYYESLGYNVVGAMNTALAYDSNAPYGYMVWDGVVLGTPEVHPGSKTYLAIDWDGTCELRSMSTPLTGNEKTAISANFGWIVKDGVLDSKTVERTSSDASRSMIGIKADGTLVFCLVDGRNAPFSTGLSNYELGEMMLALGCVNAVNCDGGGSSTFVSKREGETEATMRSIPSDGSERATINSVIIVSNAKATGEFDHAVLDSEYDYYAPGSFGAVTAMGVDAAGSPAEIPADGITWELSDAAFGTIYDDGSFELDSVKGDVTARMLYNGEIVGEKTIRVVDPDVFALALDETVLPYGKSMTIDFSCTYGADDWAVCVDGAYTLTLSDDSAAELDGNTLIGSSDEAIAGVDVTATYNADPSVSDVLVVTYGKGSEIIYDFEDGDTAGFMGFVDAKQWSIDNGVNNTLVGSDPLGGQFNEQISSSTAISSDIVRNGNYALAWSLDNTDATFANWSYNVLFNVGETIVLRDVANGKNATTLGMWLYIPEGAAGLAFQSQFYVKNADGSYSCKQDHFMFTTVSGVRKNLNSCTEADIPESRWVYASIDISGYDYLCTPVATDAGNSRSPSFIRTYVKPTVPAVHTFYIDDITLDYSSAVDDRVLPTIGDVSYTTQDESVALNEGAVINGNSISFSAVVADNIKLDNASGRILVDGNELDNVSVSGKYLTTTSNATLTSGVHTVAFEIKDTLGNPARVTRTFTVAGDAAVTLDGHNDSGMKPEYGSVYYVDVNVADITAVESLTASLLLQDANTWEPDGITVAEGFDFTYELDEVENILTLVIERNDENVDASVSTVVSAPVRLWTWDGVNNVTDTPITPESQFASGYCPIVTVDCKVAFGLVNDTDPFGGKISVATKLNDNTYPWHYHDAELAVLNKDATCTTVGYENRTYCETCQSVIDWGTEIPATGHNYVGGKCECGATNTATGLIEENGNWYYYINGVAASGWQMIGTDWYYFDTETKIGAQGDVKLNDITFNFVDGKLTSGVWVKTLYGNRYYYGPGYYNDRGSWRNIDGKDYFFFKGVALTGGYQMLYENQINLTWYYFNEDGTCDKTQTIPDGFYTDRGGYAYSKDGKGLKDTHVIDGKYYCFNYMGYAQKNGVYQGRLYLDDYAAYTGVYEKDGTLYFYQDGITAYPGLYEIDGAYYNVTWGGVIRIGEYYADTTHCDLPAGRTYISGEDGKLVNGIFERDGEKYLYFNGRIASEGLYEIDGEYYMANWQGKLMTDGRYYASFTFCDLPARNNYTFDAEGKMMNGVEEIDGQLYLYINGTTATYGLYEIDGEYYYSYWGGVVMTDGRYYVGSTYCDLPANRNYTFDAEGKMLNGIEEVDGTLYLYINGITATYGLYEIDGEYYYSYWGGVVMADGRYYVGTTFCDLPANRNYSFDAEGKMLSGIEEVDGKLYLYIDGTTATYGLYKIDGEYYYSYWGGVVMTDGRYYVGTTFCDLPANNNYSFDADGKMLNGVEEVDGELYLYIDGTTASYGLYEIDGEYYYSYWGGLLMVDGRYYVGRTKCDLPINNYTFGADGKMLNGFVTTDDGIYYYENGNTPLPKILYIDGDYYYVSWNGKVMTNTTCYVPADGIYSELSMNYTFDEFGRFVK